MDKKSVLLCIITLLWLAVCSCVMSIKLMVDHNISFVSSNHFFIHSTEIVLVFFLHTCEF